MFAVVAAQRYNQQGVHLGQQVDPCPARHAAAQGGHNPDGAGGRVVKPTTRLRIARVDQGGDEMREPEIQCRSPRLSAQTWAAADQGGHPGLSIVST